MMVRLIVLLLMLGTGVPAGADYGRLFFTPAQRAALENARKKNFQIETGESVQAETPVPRNVSVNGVVRNSEGKSTVWINNRAVDGRQVDGLNISANRNDGRVRLSVPDSGRSVDLKVGQSVEIVSGTIGENYARRVSPKPDEKALPAAEKRPASANPPAPSLPGQAQKPADAIQDPKSTGSEPDAKFNVRPAGSR